MRLFDSTGFPPRWDCGPGWAEYPWLGWLHIISDVAIWSAYLAIPAVLAYFLSRRGDLPYRRIIWLFSAFILVCGMTHLLEVITFWWPMYQLSGLLKLITAIVSWASAVALIQTVPDLLKMRNPDDLQREIEARRRAESDLQRLNAELEQRFQQRTTDLTRAADALRDERELLRTTLSSIGDGVVVTDTQGRVTFLNGVAERLTGWATRDAKGLPLEQVFHIYNDFSGKPIDNPAERALLEGTIVGLANHTVLKAKDGSERPIDESAAPIRGDVGAIRGAVVVFRDITERKRAVNRLRDQEERLRLAIEATGLGIFDYSPQTGQQEWSERCKQIWGLPPDAPVPPEVVAKAIHPDDRERAQRITETSLDPRGPGEFVMEHRLVLANGTVRWVLVRGKTIFDGAVGRRRAVRSLGTMLDITDRKMAEQALKDADRRKDEFLAILAHELRNPLAPIRNSLELMKRCNGNLTLIEQSRGTMERQLGQMVRLVDDLIDVSRISRNRLELRKERVEFASIINQAVEVSRPAADSSNHTLTISVPQEPIYLSADAVRLTQIFSNLLTNACKYTTPGGQIWLTVERVDGDVVTHVKDTGIGIPSDKLTEVFEMFTQIDRTLERTQGGLGIGLTLVKRLVEMHDGTVTAHSEGRGTGSEFIVRLPIREEQIIDSASLDGEPALTGSRRILVVDDNVDSALTLSMLLKLTGNEVQTAHDGEEAVQKAEKYRPDLILLDIGLPKLNGYAACRAIRETIWGKAIHIVALTGWGQEEDRRKSKEAGFDDHVVKPVTHATLAKILADPKLN